MITLEQLNELRSREKWDEIVEASREHLKSEQDAYALRGLAQALDKLDQRGEEYENALLRLLELKDRIADTARRLAHFYKENGDTEEAVRHMQTAAAAAAAENQHEVLEELWEELIELAPDDLPFYQKIAEDINKDKHHQRAAMLLQMLLPACAERRDWRGQLDLLRQILEYAPKDNGLREPILEAAKNLHPGSSILDDVIEFTGIKNERPLPEAMRELDLFLGFLPDNYVRHPEWGIGRVKDLDMRERRVVINFQRKRNHPMGLELASTAVENLAADDFRVLNVIDREGLKKTAKDDPVEFIKILLRSFGGTMTAKEIKERVAPDIMTVREWTSWWTNTNSALRKDPYIAVRGGASKSYTLRKTPASDEEDLLKRFDEIKGAHAKVDHINTYLRTTKKADLDPRVLRHFSQKLRVLAPTRKSAAERVELWFANEDLGNALEDIEPLPEQILEAALANKEKAVAIVPKLRFKPHQWRFAKRFKTAFPNEWQTIYRDLILAPDVLVRDQLGEALEESGAYDLLDGIVDTALNDFRVYPYTYIWLAGKAMLRKNDWIKDKLPIGTVLERLLVLVDYLTSQAKRRDKDESVWLRKVASDAREIIRKNNYYYFKESLQFIDEPTAQSIYRRAQTNEGFDGKTSADLTTIIRARFPALFESRSEAEMLIPEGVMCLPDTLAEKKALLKRLVETDMPQVVEEIETARQHGDLRENAEYHAAKDKQKLLASQVGELQEMISNPVVIRFEEIKTDTVGFGTEFKVRVQGTGEENEYVMLGPWESDPGRNILSYQAPFALAFMGKAVGETVDLDLPMHSGVYEVVSIKALTEARLAEIRQTGKNTAPAEENAAAATPS